MSSNRANKGVHCTRATLEREFKSGRAPGSLPFCTPTEHALFVQHAKYYATAVSSTAVQQYRRQPLTPKLREIKKRRTELKNREAITHAGRYPRQNLCIVSPTVMIEPVACWTLLVKDATTLSSRLALTKISSSSHSTTAAR